MAHSIHLPTCLLAIVVGLRTLGVWRRTRRVPELAIGTSVLTIAVAYQRRLGLTPPPSPAAP